jgi:hypothetical protein
LIRISKVNIQRARKEVTGQRKHALEELADAFPKMATLLVQSSGSDEELAEGELWG